ncbi:MAG: hypothetical protein QXH07_02410 [Thermoplasmata archaeon]
MEFIDKQLNLIFELSEEIAMKKKEEINKEKKEELIKRSKRKEYIYA